MPDKIYIGSSGPNADRRQYLLLDKANRHGLIAGATGTGKTVTLQVMAEEFSKHGVPVFMADVKGDLSGMCAPGNSAGKLHEPFQKRADMLGIVLAYDQFPVRLWDLFEERGKPIKASISILGPTLLSNLMGLTNTQRGVMNVAFSVSEDKNIPLDTMEEFRSLLHYMAANYELLSTEYGNIARASVGTIQRQLLALSREGGDTFFSKDCFDIRNLMECDEKGYGNINILAAERLIRAPKLYATFLLWLLESLFRDLPEIGNPDKPKIVFFFDEAHLLFSNTDKSLVDKIEQIVRLIRSKGVGVYFVTQKPDDVPENILGQLGNRVQHSLRSFTGRDRRELKRAAETYRENNEFDIATKISELGTGEAVTSFLDHKGAPGIAEHTVVRPPFSGVGPAAQHDIDAAIERTIIKYRKHGSEDTSDPRSDNMSTFMRGLLKGLFGT